MDRWSAIALALMIGCSHHDDAAHAPPTPTPAPAPAPAARAPSIDASAVVAAPVESGPVTVVDLPANASALLGAGAEGVYFARLEERGNDLPLVPLVRRTTAGSEDVIGKSVHGFAMTDDAVYWTDPGYDGPNTGGVWRVKRPAGAPEQLVSGSNLPEKLVVLGDQLVYWEGGVLLHVGKDGGSPSQLAEPGGVVFAMVADDRAAYWVGGKDEHDHRVGEVTRAGAVKTIATLDGEAQALAADDKSLYVGYASPKGIKIVALPKRGGAMTTWADGAFDDHTLVVSGGGIVLLDKDARTVERVASPGATPEVLYRAPAGSALGGLVASGGRLYVGQGTVPAH